MSNVAVGDEDTRVFVQYVRFRSKQNPVLLPWSPPSHASFVTSAGAINFNNSNYSATKKANLRVPFSTFGMSSLVIPPEWKAEAQSLSAFVELVGIDLRLSPAMRDPKTAPAVDEKQRERLVKLVETRPKGVYAAQALTEMMFAWTRKTVRIPKQLTNIDPADRKFDSKELDGQVAVGQAKSAEEKHFYITRNLHEVLLDDVIHNVLAERDLRVYWGTAPTGAPHIAYFVPMSKIADFLRAGCHVIILIADLHAYLDSMKTSWDLLKKRTEYYQRVISATLRSIGVPLDRLRFVLGSSYQLTENYTRDMYRMSALTTLHYAQKAGAEVVKQSDNPLLSGMLYPILQALDEQYLDVDVQFGGLDQRKIFTFAQEFLPKLGYAKRGHLMNPMVPGLSGGQMSSSDPSSKIDLLDSEAAVEYKIRNAFCAEGEVKGNGVLAFARYVLFPLYKGSKFLVERPEKFGGNASFSTYEELEAAFVAKQLYPLDLKHAVAKAINALLAPIRKEFEDPYLKQLTLDAYPDRQPFVVPGSESKNEDGDAATAAAGDSKSAAGKGKAKPAKGGKGGAVAAAAADVGDSVAALELRVGVVTGAEVHPEKDHLYVVQVDVADDSKKPRQVVSGIAKQISKDDLVGKKVVVFTNTKASKFSGVDSEGMIFAAYNDQNQVELLHVPDDAPAGSRITFAGLPVPATYEILSSKGAKKLLDMHIPRLAADAEGVAKYDGIAVMSTATGQPITVSQLKGAKIK